MTLMENKNCLIEKIFFPQYIFTPHQKKNNVTLWPGYCGVFFSLTFLFNDEQSDSF